MVAPLMVPPVTLLPETVPLNVAAPVAASSVTVAAPFASVSLSPESLRAMRPFVDRNTLPVMVVPLMDEPLVMLPRSAIAPVPASSVNTLLSEPSLAMMPLSLSRSRPFDVRNMPPWMVLPESASAEIFAPVTELAASLSAFTLFAASLSAVTAPDTMLAALMAFAATFPAVTELAASLSAVTAFAAMFPALTLFAASFPAATAPAAMLVAVTLLAASLSAVTLPAPSLSAVTAFARSLSPAIVPAAMMSLATSSKSFHFDPSQVRTSSAWSSTVLRMLGELSGSPFQ